MQYGASTYTDDFNQSDTPLPLGGWEMAGSVGGSFQIVSNAVQIKSTGMTGNPRIARIRNVDIGDQEAVFDVTTENDLTYGPSVRVQSDGEGYHAEIGWSSSGAFGMISYHDGANDNITMLAENNNLLAGNSTWNFGDTHRAKLRVTGSTIELLINDVVQITTTDTQATSGSPGFNASYTVSDTTAIATSTVDNFFAKISAFTSTAYLRPEFWLIYLGKEETEGTANNANNAFEYAKTTLGANTDPYYTSGANPTLTYGTSYESLVLQKDSSVADHLLSENDNRNYFPPLAVWKSEASAIAEGDNAKFCMKFLILPEGFDDDDNPIVSQWKPTGSSNFYTANPIPPKYDISFEESSQSGLYIMTIKNTSTVGQEDAYSDQFADIAKCLMTDNTIQTFTTLEDAQAATNPSLLAVVRCDTGAEISLDGNLSVADLEALPVDTTGTGSPVYDDAKMEIIYQAQDDPEGIFADIKTLPKITYQNLSGLPFASGVIPTTQQTTSNVFMSAGQFAGDDIYTRFYRDFSINSLVTKINEIHPQGTGDPDNLPDLPSGD